MPRGNPRRLDERDMAVMVAFMKLTRPTLTDRDLARSFLTSRTFPAVGSKKGLTLAGEESLMRYIRRARRNFPEITPQTIADWLPQLIRFKS